MAIALITFSTAQADLVVNSAGDVVADSIYVDYIKFNGTTPCIIRSNISNEGDIIIPSGVTLTITSYLTMHPEAQILIQGGKLILDGGTIRNGDIRNNGNLTILNNGIVEMCGSDQYRHKPSELDVINNGNTPFPATTNIQQGAFMRVNR